MLFYQNAGLKQLEALCEFLQELKHVLLARPGARFVSGFLQLEVAKQLK
jgi:hypothetical protein